jgi:hypothetical protein
MLAYIFLCFMCFVAGYFIGYTSPNKDEDVE